MRGQRTDVVAAVRVEQMVVLPAPVEGVDVTQRHAVRVGPTLLADSTRHD